MKKRVLFILKLLLIISSILAFIMRDHTNIKDSSIDLDLSFLLVFNAAFVITLCLYSFIKNTNRKRYVHIVGIVNGLIMYIGFRFTFYDSIVPGNNAELIYALLYIFGAYFTYTYMLYWVIHISERLQKTSSERFVSIERKIHSANELWFLIIVCLFIFICWMPYILIRYPAGIEWDASHQILQIVGSDKLTNHWPVFSTYLFGYSIKFGKELFGSYNTALFVFAIIQSLVSAAVLSYSILYMKRKKASLLLMIIALAIYSIVPLFPGYLTSITKDALYSDAVLIFVILFSAYVYDDNSRFKAIIVCIFSILVCLLRNNGKYILLFTGLFGLFCSKKENKESIRRISILMLLIMVLTTASLNVYLTVNNIPKGNVKLGNIREALSIPFQQTARYLVYYPDDISEKETEVLNRVFNVEYIKENYNPLLSDPVKRTFHADIDDLIAYFPVYLRMFFRHPIIYLDAPLENSYGFFYPFAIAESKVNSGIYLIRETLDPETIEYLNINTESPFCFYDDELIDYVKTLENGLFSRLPCSIGFWVLLTIDIFIYAVCRKRNRLFLVLMPSMTGIIVCFASPTWYHNGFRYALPVVMSAMVLLATVYYERTHIK